VFASVDDRRRRSFSPQTFDCRDLANDRLPAHWHTPLATPGKRAIYPQSHGKAMFSTDMRDHSLTMDHPRVYYFRIRFLGPTLGLTFLASAVAALLIFFDGRNRPLDPIGLLIARLVPIPIAALFIGLLMWLCRIRVTPRGIKYPAWPLLVRELPWEEMHMVQHVNLLGFRFLAIYKHGAAAGLWLPLFLKNPDLFSEAVRAYLPGDHPLAVCLGRCCA
jgi:hypothetical protein